MAVSCTVTSFAIKIRIRIRAIPIVYVMNAYDLKRPYTNEKPQWTRVHIYFNFKIYGFSCCRQFYIVDMYVVYLHATKGVLHFEHAACGILKCNFLRPKHYSIILCCVALEGIYLLASECYTLWGGTCRAEPALTFENRFYSAWVI